MFWNKILEIFKSQPQPISEPEMIEDRYIKDLKLYDDVYLKINNSIYEGWIYEIGKNTLSVIYDNDQKELCECRFIIKNLNHQKVITNRNITLIINQKDALL